MSHCVIEKNAFDIVKNNLNNCECYYATTIKDEMTIKNAFMTAKLNSEINDFPDFIFDGGFIEHFSITSSKENKKGSKLKQEEAKMNRDFSKSEESFKNYMNENPSFNEVNSITKEYKYNENHSHEYLMKSFFDNFNSHIESCENYYGDKSIKIYLVEYNDFNLRMHVSYKGLKTDRHYGDLLIREPDTLYRISRDKELLMKLYEYTDKIDYLIFKSSERIEIINVKDILEIIKLVKYDYEYGDVVAVKVMTTKCISVKNESGETK